MTGLLESGVRKPFICLGPTTEVSAHSGGCEEVPRVWPFNATEKLGPDISELLSMHCSWCVLDYGEAQCRCLAGLVWSSSRMASITPTHGPSLGRLARFSLVHRVVEDWEHTPDP